MELRVARQAIKRAEQPADVAGVASQHVVSFNVRTDGADDAWLVGPSAPIDTRAEAQASNLIMPPCGPCSCARHS
jgi:hypothetical protein